MNWKGPWERERKQFLGPVSQAMLCVLVVTSLFSQQPQEVTIILRNNNNPSTDEVIKAQKGKEFVPNPRLKISGGSLWTLLSGLHLLHRSTERLHVVGRGKGTKIHQWTQSIFSEVLNFSSGPLWLAWRVLLFILGPDVFNWAILW